MANCLENQPTGKSESLVGQKHWVVLLPSSNCNLQNQPDKVEHRQIVLNPIHHPDTRITQPANNTHTKAQCIERLVQVSLFRPVKAKEDSYDRVIDGQHQMITEYMEIDHLLAPVMSVIVIDEAVGIGAHQIEQKDDIDGGDVVCRLKLQQQRFSPGDGTKGIFHGCGGDSLTKCFEPVFMSKLLVHWSRISIS